MKDADVLDLARLSGFDECVEDRSCAGSILVPDKVSIRDVIEDLLLIWRLTEANEWMNRVEWLPL